MSRAMPLRISPLNKTMVKVKVNTIWQGKVGLRDKYVRQVMDFEADLEISKGSEIMVIPYKNVEKSIVGKSKPMVDKFSNEFHTLCYFDWKPTIVQQQLL